MNDTTKLIFERRSVKAYSDKPVSDADLKTIVESRLWAPNGRNLQARFFSVVKSPDLMDKFITAIREVRDDPAANPFYGAPCVIYISADKESTMADLDAGAAMENMIITAASLGIDSCFMVGPLSLFTHADADAFKKDLRFPENYRPVCALILGYRADGVNPESTRDLDKAAYI